jgi:hypothetical protein
MNESPQKLIGRPGYWLIFAGIPWALISLIYVPIEAHGGLEHLLRILGAKTYSYLLGACVLVIYVGAWVIYDKFPKTWIVCCGSDGWIVGFGLLYWFFWFGPGVWK